MSLKPGFRIPALGPGLAAFGLSRLLDAAVRSAPRSVTGNHYFPRTCYQIPEVYSPAASRRFRLTQQTRP